MAFIEDPILNSPFREPDRHFKFDEDGITNEIVTGRRPSSHFVPIPRAKKKGKQLQFDTEWTKDRIEPNPWWTAFGSGSPRGVRAATSA